MSGEILDLSTQLPPEGLSVDVCIVGSGTGGATAAWELAAAGKDVVVLEEGGDFTGLALTQRDGDMYDQLYMERGGRSTADLTISILQGRVLGGGGVINACDVVPLSDGVLEHWRSAYGLTDFTPEVLEPFRAAALRDLHASTPGEHLVNRNNALLRGGAQALGWAGALMLHNRVGCAGVGTCLVGCPLDAKKNPRFVAIPAALKAGARFFIRTRALKLSGATSDRKTVEAVTLDGRGYHEQRPFTVRARTVILAANAVASAQLLLRSGLGNAHVGRHLSLQPQLPITAVFDEEIRFFRGIPQTFAVTQFEQPADATRPLGGFRIEAIGGTPGIVASMLSILGHEGKAYMQDFPRLAASLLLVPDGGSGTVRVERSGRLRVDYELPPAQIATYRAAARAAATLYLTAGAREVVIPGTPVVRIRSREELDLCDRLDFSAAVTPLISAHQQGTVRFAANERDGGARPDGEVYGTRGVYVFDSSGYPTSSSSHTMAPILTTSRYLARRLIG